MSGAVSLIPVDSSAALMGHDPTPPHSAVKIQEYSLSERVAHLESYVPGNSPAVVTAATISSVYAAHADTSMMIRSPFKHNFIMLQSVGFSTLMNVPAGFLSALAAVKKLAISLWNKDKTGVTIDSLTVAQSISQFSGGGVYIGYRAATLASLCTRSPAAGAASFGLGTIGNALFGLFFAFIGITSGVKFHENAKFRSALTKAIDKNNFVDFLSEKLVATPLKAMRKYRNNEESFKEHYRALALDHLAKQLIRMQEEFGGKEKLTYEQAKEHYNDLFHSSTEDFKERYFEALEGGLTAEQRADLRTAFADLDLLALMGLSYETHLRQSKKLAKFTRVTNAACTTKVKKALERGLAFRPEDVKPIQAEILSLNKKNHFFQALGITISVVGVAMSILGVGLALPAVLTAYVYVSTILGLIMFLGDGYDALVGLKQGPPGKWDKAYIIGAAVMAVVGCAVGTALTLIFTTHLLPVIVAAVFTIGVLVLLGVWMNQLIQKEKRWKNEHLSLGDFKNQLSKIDQPLDARLRQIFKNLPKADRLAIREEYAALKEVQFDSRYLSLDERAQLKRACAKSVKYFWDEFRRTQSEESRENALKAQKLVDSIVVDGVSLKFRLEQFGIEQVEGNALYERLRADISYVCERESSQKTLRARISVVIVKKENAVDPGRAIFEELRSAING